MLEQIPGEPDDPAFMVIQKGEKLALSANQLIARLRKWLTLIGEDAEKYALHSLRRGGATFAMQCDIQGEMIKLLGDWPVMLGGDIVISPWSRDTIQCKPL